MDTKYTEFSIKFPWKLTISRKQRQYRLAVKDKKSRYITGNNIERLEESDWDGDVDVVK